ncbi:MAG: flotillin-like FloA family protein, partial [Acidobacteriota bacterium]
MDLVILVFFGLLAFLFLFSYLIPIRLWLAARFAGAHVSLTTLIGMRFRRVPPKVVVEPRISAVRAGLNIPVPPLESHYLAGGNVAKVVYALISADKAGIELDFQRAAAIDLAGRDVL